jgi:hypothetical protein
VVKCPIKTRPKWGNHESLLKVMFRNDNPQKLDANVSKSPHIHHTRIHNIAGCGVSKNAAYPQTNHFNGKMMITRW